MPARATLAALLVLPLALLALAPAAEAATTRALTITGATAQPTAAFKAFDGNPGKVFDFNADGRLEVVAQNDNNWVYVFDSSTGAKLAELRTTFPAGWGARTFNGPEAYRDDGVSHLVVGNSAAYITSFRYEPSTSTATKFTFVKEWERRTTDCFSAPGSDAKPTIADLDRDGNYEIVATTEEVGVVALRANGSLYWKKCIGGGNGDATVGDLDQDGWPEVVFGSDGGVVTAMNGRTGATKWSLGLLSRYNLGSASIPVGVAVGQLDGVGGLEVVAGARDSHDPNNWTRDHAMLVAIGPTGTVLWARQDSTGNPLTYTHPIIADAAGDGQAEVYWADWNTIGHKPPFEESEAWQVTGPANFYRYDKAGNLVWKQSLGTYWGNKDLALADIDADGVQEVLATGPSGGHEGIWALDSRTGAKESFADAYPWMVTRGPIVADLHGTGRMQYVLQVGPQATSAGAAIHVYDTGSAYSSAWPHLPYPQPTTPAPPPPPPAGSFAATFTVKSPNSWWQEVSVRPDTARTVASVSIRFPGHDWQPMAKSSWGAWTSSHHTPAGTQVEFLARDSGGFESQSLPFTWLDGTLSKRSTAGGAGTTSTSSTSPSSSASSTTSSTSSTTSGTGSPFTASFAPRAVGNDWWVEATVTANHPLAKVEARVGAGAWVLLDRTDWGTWAKSIHAPNGSQVTFRATDTAGATVTGAPVGWP